MPDPLCERCDYSDKARNPCLVSELSGTPGTRGKLVVVLESPTGADDRANRPFTSTSGQFLRKLIAPLWDGEIVYTYALRCPTPKKVKPSAYKACQPYMTKTVQDAEPEVILCFGAGAMHTVVGRGYPTFDVRKGYAWLDSGALVFFLIPPYSALRNRIVHSWLLEDLKWALNFDRAYDLQELPFRGHCRMVATVEDVVTVLEFLEISHYLTVDLETFGRPGNKEFRVLNMAITADGDNAAFVLDADAMATPEVCMPILLFLCRTGIPLGGHNVKYDIVCLWVKYGVRLTTGFDTGLWRKLLDCNAKIRLEYAQPLIGMSGGKDEAKAYITAGVRELRNIIKKPETPQKLFNLPVDDLTAATQRIAAGDEPKAYAYAAIPPEIRSRYNALDTVSTDRVRAHLQKQLDARPNIQAIWTLITKPLQHAIEAMEYNGIMADSSKVAEIQVMMSAQIAEYKAVLVRYDDEVNWNHAPSVATVLTRILGKPIASTAKAILEKLKHPVTDALIEYRRASKFKAQYADSMGAFIRDDGRIHPSFNIAGTVTGRPSCEKPNLLNIPRAESEGGKLCRDVFIAPPKRKLVEADYSQIELRVAAMKSGDERMIELFKSGADFHLETAKNPIVCGAFGLEPDEIDADHWLRSGAKTVNFAVLYGTSPAAIAARLGISKQEAETLMSAILGQFPQLNTWIKKCLKFSRKHGYTYTWWDGIEPFRVRPLQDIVSADEEARGTAERCSWNTPIQGTASEYTNASLGAIQAKLDAGTLPASAKIVLTVYDSILFEVDDEDVDELVAGVVQVMESWNSCGVPIVADVKVGQSWGSLEKYNA